MTDQLETSSNQRFWWHMRRLWFVPLVVAALLVLAGSQAFGGTDYEGVLRAASVRESGLLATSQLPPDLIGTDTTFENSVLGVDQAAVESELVATVPGATSATFAFSPQRTAVNVVVLGTSVEAVQQAFDFYEDRLTDELMQASEATLAATAEQLEASIASQADRIAQLEAEVAALPADSPGEVQASLLDEIGVRNGGILIDQRSLETLNSTAGTSSELIRFGRGEVIERNSGLIVLPALALFGAGVGILMVWAISRLDRRVRGAFDTVALLGDPSVVSVDGLRTRADLERSGRLLTERNHPNQHGLSFVAADNAESTVNATQLLASVAVGDVSVPGEARGPAESLEVGDSSRDVVLVMTRSVTRFDDVRRVVGQLRLAGRRIDSVLVVDRSADRRG